MTPPPPPFTYRQWMFVFDVMFCLFMVLALIAIVRGELTSYLVLFVMALVSWRYSDQAQKGRDGER